MLPTVIPGADGTLMQSVGKYARNSVMTVYQMIGGDSAMAEWASENRGDFYTKMFTKIVQKEVEHSTAGSVEDMLEHLDRKLVDITPGEFTDVTDEG
jgi:hypothetical protein